MQCQSTNATNDASAPANSAQPAPYLPPIKLFHLKQKIKLKQNQKKKKQYEIETKTKYKNSKKLCHDKNDCSGKDSNNKTLKATKQTI